MNPTEQVKRLLSDNYELRDIHDSLADNLEFTKFLDDMLDNHNALFGPKASPDIGQPDLKTFFATGRSLAKQYVDQPRWHTPWLTRYLLDDVLEGQCAYLTWRAKWGVFPAWSLRHFLPSPYRTFIPPLVSLAIFGCSVGLLYWLLTKEYFSAAALPGAWMLYFYLIEKPLTWWRRHKNRAQYTRLAQMLVVPLNEIRTSNYDPKTISRRLRACVQKDLHVASIVFALLKLPSHGSPSSATPT
jgi:hypothetical protein